ncbi:MAG: hypothetical protein N2Z73_03665 [Endomicrobia bacterium]|nr:hypothetical protein [Endomicrobiia bacterium]
MPLPKTTDVGKIIRFLKREKPSMPKKQMLAIALSQVRKYARGKRKKVLEEAYKKYKGGK